MMINTPMTSTHLRVTACTHSPMFKPIFDFTYSAHELQAGGKYTSLETGSENTVSDDYVKFGTAILGVADANYDTMPCLVTVVLCALHRWVSLLL